MILKVILLLTNIICVSSTSWCSDSPMQLFRMGCASPNCVNDYDI